MAILSNIFRKIIYRIKTKFNKFKYKEPTINYFNRISLKYSKFADDIFLTDFQKGVCKNSFENYKIAIKEINNNIEFKKFIGEDWDTFSSQARNIILNSDINSVFSSLGLRSYKTLLPNNLPSAFEFNKIQQTQQSIYEILLDLNGTSLDIFRPYECLNYPKIALRNKSNKMIFLNPTQTKSIEDSLYIKKNIVKRKDNYLFIEIGGGDGHHCKSICQVIPNSKYFIFDLPEMCFRSYSLLSNHFSGQKLIGGLKEFNQLERNVNDFVDKYEVAILPCWLIPEFCSANLEFDCGINIHSFGEMPLQIAKNYISNLEKCCEFLYLINREFGFKWSSTVKNTKLKEIGIEEYLNFENHILIDVDYPISSNPIHTYGQNPSYIRTIFKRKTI
tara:strand:- start:727 stop:1893 length:1167 start_codon:yes stop_codon:yes gene_type:complete